MGQARRRGTFEERREQSIQTAARLKQERAAAEAARWEALTDDQREAELRRKRRMAGKLSTFALLSGLAYGGGM